MDTNGHVLDLQSVPEESTGSSSVNASINPEALQIVLKKMEQIELECKRKDDHLMSLIESLIERVDSISLH